MIEKIKEAKSQTTLRDQNQEGIELEKPMKVKILIITHNSIKMKLA